VRQIWFLLTAWCVCWLARATDHALVIGILSGVASCGLGNLILSYQSIRHHVYSPEHRARVATERPPDTRLRSVRALLALSLLCQWSPQPMALPTIIMPTYTTPSRAARNTRATRQSRTRTGIGSSNPLPSPTAPFDDDPKWKLFITTNNKICAWDYSGCEPIFTSSSRGIVAAKRARDGKFSFVALGYPGKCSVVPRFGIGDCGRTSCHASSDERWSRQILPTEGNAG
jgi:hypothetical protein